MIDIVDHPGSEKFSPARSIGAIMADYMSKHDDFYLFSPDETTSNQMADHASKEGVLGEQFDNLAIKRFWQIEISAC